MKEFFKSVIMAFSMYSTIPMPKINWDEKSMRYVPATLHFVGIIILFFECIFFTICKYYQFSNCFFSGISVVLPIIITGGIHMDGFSDTCDALYSRREREEKLNILKDSHVGAFAVLGVSCLLIFRFAMFSQLYAKPKYFIIYVFCHIISRLLSGMSVVAFKKAKKDGLVATFAHAAEQKKCKMMIVIALFVSCIIMLYLSWVVSLINLALMLAWFYVYYIICMKQFGGTTGDLAGFFLEVCETISLFSVTFLGVVLQ